MGSPVVYLATFCIKACHRQTATEEFWRINGIENDCRVLLEDGRYVVLLAAILPSNFCPNLQGNQFKTINNFIYRYIDLFEKWLPFNYSFISYASKLALLASFMCLQFKIIFGS